MDKLKIEEYSEKLWQIHIGVSGFYNEYAKSVGLTLAEFKVLAILYKTENPTQVKITQLAYLPKQTVNAIIKGFLKKELIELIESPTDKRNKVLSFTKSGYEYANNLISKAKDLEYRALSSIGEEKIKSLIEVMTMYRDNLKVE